MPAREKISNNEIKRLAEVAGVLRIDKNVYPYSRNVIHSLLLQTISGAKLVSEYKKVKTLKRTTIMSTFELAGISVSAPMVVNRMKKKSRKKNTKKKSDGTSKPHRFRPGTGTRKDIPRLQKVSNKFMIRPKPFRDHVRDIVRAITPKNEDVLRISANSFVLLQFYIESALIKLMRDAYLIPLTTTRTKGKTPRLTLFVKDLELATELTLG